jgi:hypothetical protein
MVSVVAVIIVGVFYQNSGDPPLQKCRVFVGVREEFFLRRFE